MFKSIRALIGFTLRGRDSDVGRVKDALVDETFRVRFLVVTTGWLGGKTVLLASEWVSRVDMQTEVLYADISSAEFDTAPEYREQVPIDEPYESTLYEHFHKPRQAGLAAEHHAL
jgi:hypothetical protein